MGAGGLVVVGGGKVRLLVVAVLAVVLVGLLPVAGWGVGRLVVGLMVGWCR